MPPTNTTKTLFLLPSMAREDGEGGNWREVWGILRPLAAVVPLFPEGERTRAHTRQLGCATLA